MTIILTSRIQGAIFLLTLWSSSILVWSFIPQTITFLTYPTRTERIKEVLSSSTSISMETIASSFETKIEMESEKVPKQRKTLRKKSGIKVSSRVIGKKPTNLETVNTLAQYTDKINQMKDSHIIVTKFYADWCKSCKAISSLFRRLARRHPDVTFIEVPVQLENADLHQGLNITAVPFAHIYYPSAGLVEEKMISNSHWSEFEKVFKTYREGSCNIDSN